jgi:hypothetical protein
MENDTKMGSRRTFLRSAGSLGGALALSSHASAEAAPLLPTVKFGKAGITRLIVGSNPFYGYSHFNRTLDGLMREFYTQDRRLQVLRNAERNGINTWQVHYNDQPLADYLRYRAEGGKMNLILLADFEMVKNPKIVPGVVAKMKPLGVAYHGNRTDNRFRAGEKGVVKEFCKIVRDTGVMVGVSAHNPACFDVIESENWDVDYFQTCLYRVSRTLEESRQEFREAPIGETFMEKDPERMCKMIRATKKPCLAFKVFGAGRNTNTPEEIEHALRFALTNIKPTDAVIVGTYPKFKDEMKENADLVRRILS